MTDEQKAKGGYARAEALAPEKRTEIAAKAADARWNRVPKVKKKGVLALGTARIPCAVLDDERRVLSEHGITVALLGSRSGASKRRKRDGAPLPLFLAPNNLKPFIPAYLANGPLAPIVYEDGSREVVGYEAAVLPEACNVWLEARESGKLQDQQLDKAQKAEILMRSLAHVGIIALVDEATGYQSERPQNALQAYLELILRKELAAWVKKFPDEFYENIYRLKGWKWPGMSKNRYSVVAHYTRDLVYQRLAPGVLAELEQKAPKDENGNRKGKLHQWLTADVGDPMLSQHMHSLLMFQRLALSSGYGWNRFVKMVDQVLPKKGATLELPFSAETGSRLR